MSLLHELVTAAAARQPDAPAIRRDAQRLSYGALEALSNQVARRLAALGVGPGDRVGLWHAKDVRVVAAMIGVLKLGAAYVPLDPLSPVQRARTIIDGCEMRALVCGADRAETLRSNAASLPALLLIDGGADEAAWPAVAAEPSSAYPTPPRDQNELAYILYTSGSTGTPKGVCISHLNALAFVEWAAGVLEAQENDLLANHAPMHFDLSVLDLYVAFLAGAEVALIPEGVTYVPGKLVAWIASERPTIWYSVPSALILMTSHGGLLELPNSPLRVICFAGEPFPVKHLRLLQRGWPQVRLLNLYGPTETNVCTYYEVSGSLQGRTRPVPIGDACSGDRVWAVKADGTTAGTGEEGELMVAGPTVMLGYWGRKPHGTQPYATGDVVRSLEEGGYEYLGRRDHMVKVRGHRVELGEIEAALLAHPAIEQAAVLVSGAGIEAKLVAVVVAGEGKPSLLALKQHCAERLPRYMIIDRLRAVPAMPRTRTGKIDRRRLLDDLNSAKEGL